MHILVYIGRFFLLLSYIPLYERIIICYTYASVDEHLSCFQFLAIMNIATLNTVYNVGVGGHMFSFLLSKYQEVK